MNCSKVHAGDGDVPARSAPWADVGEACQGSDVPSWPPQVDRRDAAGAADAGEPLSRCPAPSWAQVVTGKCTRDRFEIDLSGVPGQPFPCVQGADQEVPARLRVLMNSARDNGRAGALRSW